jgi:hypothetical protein
MVSTGAGGGGAGATTTGAWAGAGVITGTNCAMAVEAPPSRAEPATAAQVRRSDMRRILRELLGNRNGAPARQL